MQQIINKVKELNTEIGDKTSFFIYLLERFNRYRLKQHAFVSQFWLSEEKILN